MGYLFRGNDFSFKLSPIVCIMKPLAILVSLGVINIVVVKSGGQAGWQYWKAGKQSCRGYICDPDLYFYMHGDLLMRVIMSSVCENSFTQKLPCQLFLSFLMQNP